MERIPYRVFTFLILTACCLFSSVRAEDELGNKVTAYLSPGATKHDAVIELWMENVNPVIGITVPVKFATGGDSLALDSLFLTGGRAKDFATFKPLFKSANKTLLVNMVWKLDTVSTVDPIPPGAGPFLWLYMSTPEEFPFDKFKMASVQIPPENVMLYVTEMLNPVNPDFEFKRGAAPKSTSAKPADVKSEEQKKTP